MPRALPNPGREDEGSVKGEFHSDQKIVAGGRDYQERADSGGGSVVCPEHFRNSVQVKMAQKEVCLPVYCVTIFGV